MSTTTFVILVAIIITGVIYFEWFYNLIKPKKSETLVLSHDCYNKDKIYSLTNSEIREDLYSILEEIARIENCAVLVKNQKNFESCIASARFKVHTMLEKTRTRN